jgi:hypothetical protein
MLAFSPDTAVIVELLGDDGIHVDVLRHVVVVPGGKLQGARTVGCHPDGRMRLLVGLGDW